MANMKIRFKTKVKGGKPEADGKTFVLEADKALAYINRGLAVEVPLTDDEKKAAEAEKRAAAEAEKRAAAEAEKAAKAEAERLAKEEAEKKAAAAGQNK